MKTQILDTGGKKIKEITTNLFEEPIREDIIFKVIEAERIWQPYSNYHWAGMDRSASGNIRHKRHSWKVSYGHGMSRVPRKIMTKRGSRFFWVGATIASARGGREAHPPKILRREKKINEKEKLKALKSAIAATASQHMIKKKYGVEFKLPIIIDSKILSLKLKEIMKFLEKVIGKKFLKKILLIIAEKEKFQSKMLESCKVKQLNIQKLVPGGKPGRLIIYTENAID